MTNYNTADQLYHQLCQSIAKANRSYVQALTDDSHTNLFFDGVDNRILGRWIEVNNQKVCLSLNMFNLHYEWLDPSLSCIQSVNPIGKRIEVIEAELAKNLEEFNLDPSGFIDPLHFEIPIYSFINDPIQELNESAINEWVYYRSLANDACHWLSGHLQIPGEVRIWPHHFDTGVYVQPNEKIGFGFGLAMQDELVGAPYFYMAGYPKQMNLSYNNLTDLGTAKWIVTDHWKGATFSLEACQQYTAEELKVLINRFIKHASSWYLVQ